MLPTSSQAQQKGLFFALQVFPGENHKFTTARAAAKIKGTCTERKGRVVELALNWWPILIYNKYIVYYT